MTKENFWKWFDKNKAGLEIFFSSEPRGYAIYETLSENLKQCSEYNAMTKIETVKIKKPDSNQSKKALKHLMI